MLAGKHKISQYARVNVNKSYGGVAWFETAQLPSSRLTVNVVKVTFSPRPEKTDPMIRF